jgi:LDH2 family malate/lactate/ureidoglycolate dehydrogenase
MTTAASPTMGEKGLNASAASVCAQTLAILDAWGMPRDLAETTAEIMAETDLSGVDSHGISMLMMYEQLHLAGQLKLDARPKVLREAAAMALVDGGAGLGHPAADLGMKLAVKKAKAGGIGAVGVRNSHHFGAAGWYAQLALRQGCIGMVTSTARTLLMVPTRGALPVLGTNPIAFAAPGLREPPLLLDMATTTVAGNKVKVYELNGKPLPEGWVMDGTGRPVRDAAEAMAYLHRRPEGGITPLGGTEQQGSHKGYGLALMVQALAGTLTGAAFPALHNRERKPGDPDNIGHFFLAIDPKAFLDEGVFEQELDLALGVLRGTPAAEVGKPVLIPGDPERIARAERLRRGIPIPPALDRHIRDICGRCGAPYLLEAAAN